jgi:hypothetical protein
VNLKSILETILRVQILVEHNRKKIGIIILKKVLIDFISAK